MSSATKCIFLMAVIIYVCAAQLSKSQSCLCHDDVRSFTPKMGIKDLTIYPATIFCNKVEIIVSTKNGSYFCLKPKAVTRILTNLMRRKAISSTDSPAVSTSTTLSSSNTTNF